MNVLHSNLNFKPLFDSSLSKNLRYVLWISWRAREHSQRTLADLKKPEIFQYVISETKWKLERWQCISNGIKAGTANFPQLVVLLLDHYTRKFECSPSFPVQADFRFEVCVSSPVAHYGRNILQKYLQFLFPFHLNFYHPVHFWAISFSLAHVPCCG